MKSGNLARWCKKEGDRLKSGDILAEIETDKALMEIEVVDEGILGKIVVPEGSENVLVNTLIAFVLEEGEDLSHIKEESPPQVQEQKKAHHTTLPQEEIIKTPSSTHRIIASPLAKKIARNEQISLCDVVGSGPKGRIIAADLKNISPKLEKTHHIATEREGHTDIPLSSVRKIIGKRLQESKQIIPHFYISLECKMDALLKLRRELPAKFSINDFIVRACAIAMQKFPNINATYHDAFVRQYTHSNICIAVSIEGGLLTPIVYQAEQKSLQTLSNEIKILADRARKGQLKPEEYQGGAITISNLGMYGVTSFGAIINPPQACILAVSGVREVPWVKGTEIGIAHIMNLTLSADHRIIDGAYGAEFLNEIKRLLENPLTMLI